MLIQIVPLLSKNSFSLKFAFESKFQGQSIDTKNDQKSKFT